MAKPPSRLKSFFRFAVIVAINMVNAIYDAAAFVKRPANKNIPPLSSAFLQGMQ